jgi:hypothetical protein
VPIADRRLDVITNSKTSIPRLRVATLQEGLEVLVDRQHSNTIEFRARIGRRRYALALANRTP